ncbi:UNVERIFIED_CONTAM: hypothetical protein Sradi_6779200 [Sesamum radiatum]|uniref:U-box domain-containing protein n=1 Tax=Sesamum radiatum TaxID=300843 RepID=A0AAW2JRK6_SESRA
MIIFLSVKQVPTSPDFCKFQYFPPPLPPRPSQAAPPPPPPPVQPPPPAQPESSSSSSSNTSQSFTQWRFPLSNSPISHHSYSQPKAEAASEPDPKLEAVPPLLTNASLEELFHVAELQFSSGSDAGRLGPSTCWSGPWFRIHVPLLTAASARPRWWLGWWRACRRGGRKPASKVLLALCLVEGNRRVAVEAGAVTAVVEALTDAESAVAERLLAALELLCTTAEGAAEVRAHALAVPMMVQVMGRMEGRGKEHAISVLAVIYGGLEEGVGVAPAEEVARAVMLALQGDCSARGRRKGAQLLKILEEKGGVEEER